ncbi:MAG: ABC transporter permease [Actinobacteria bacterium]|nr:ABC transporter permease [Actinomycetota bacterium]MBV8957489.1 ABC transporter permease [Actinomycetota bacterium]MBV9256354.1 ABC transporter permease [Actinomycetota bacterium]MBV9662936.1 ABC transporter permease [Actinomycetota bacterium]MBV9932967.1 ABC transporter permease [Actinomycetota bacterium]
MLTFVARRIAYSVPVVLVASLLVFVFVYNTTDPLARYRASRDPTVITQQGLRAGLLEKPCTVVGHSAGGNEILKCHKRNVFKQYGSWLSKFVRGDMGTSFVTGHRVSTDLRNALWNTLQLIVWGVLLSALLAIAIGVYSAVRQYSILDYTFTGLSFVGLSMPPFWFGLIAIQFFSIDLKNWFNLKEPIFFSIGLHSSQGAGFIDFGRHLFLPVITLTVQIIAEWSRYQRSSMLDVMSSDYIRTARAKGLGRRQVVFKHGLRNALIPLVTVMAIDIGALFGGLLVTEQIFSWPGMGKLFLDALLNGDTNVLLPWLMVTALFIILFNLLADVLYGLLDPRIRLA